MGNDEIQISKAELIELLNASGLVSALFEENRLVWRSALAETIFGDAAKPGVTSEELVTRVVPNVHMRVSLLEHARSSNSTVNQNAMQRPLQLECRSKTGEMLNCEIFICRREKWSLLQLNVVSTFRLNAEILCETQKMASLGRLSEGLAHEINNPLAAIGQNLQLIWHRLLMSTSKNKETAKQCGISLQALERYLTSRGITEMFDTVLEQNLRASKIVHEMLQFAPDGRRHHYYPQPVEELISQSVLLARKDFFQESPLGFERLRLHIHVDDNVPLVVCQAWKIQQVFFAIIKNAVEAVQKKFGLSDGGRLDIAASKRERFVEIRFADNGSGMDAETRSKVFEPYFTTKTGNQGTGLGLASCYYIIYQEHYGEIRVEAEPGEGSVFTVRIPYQDDTLTSGMFSIIPSEDL